VQSSKGKPPLLCGDLGSVQILLEYFQRFTKASRLRISAEKSMVCAEMDRGLKDHILHTIDFKEGTLPMRYLGVPLTPHKLSEKDTQVLMEKTKYGKDTTMD